MEKFDINRIIEYYKLDTEEVSKVLFPNVKYPKQAFDRVLKGEANLDTEQIERLASHMCVLTTELFSADTWKGSSEDGCLVMLKGEYKVKLNYNGVYVSIYKNNSLILQNISNVPSMTMQEFINYINNVIKDYENGNN